MPKVDTTHSCYSSLQAKRDVFDAVMGGTDGLWSGDTKYLPAYPGENNNSYVARKKMSTIDGIVAGGVDGLCGATFHGDIDVTKVAPTIQPLLENIDNEGNSFNVFARRAFKESFNGYSLILVDQPSVDQSQVQSLEDKNNLGIRPYWRLYTAANIWNWRYRVNPKTQSRELSLLVLREITEEVKDVFESKSVTRFRVYTFDARNIVSWSLWGENPTAKGEDDKYIIESYGFLPYFSTIPASIVGCLGEEPKLLVESRLEILGYQKESSFNIIEYLSIPVLYTKDWQPKDENEKLAIGASAHIKLSKDGEVGYAQIDSTGHASLKETIANIKNTIKSRLNFIVESAIKQGGTKTATQANIEDKDKQARLIVWAEQFADALELALSFTAEAMGLGKDKGGEIELMSRWNVNDDPVKQKAQLEAIQLEADVFDIPVEMVREMHGDEFGLTDEQIAELNAQNQLMPDNTDANSPNPNDAGTN